MDVIKFEISLTFLSGLEMTGKKDEACVIINGEHFEHLCVSTWNRYALSARRWSHQSKTPSSQNPNTNILYNGIELHRWLRPCCLLRCDLQNMLDIYIQTYNSLRLKLKLQDEDSVYFPPIFPWECLCEWPNLGVIITLINEKINIILDSTRLSIPQQWLEYKDKVVIYRPW